MLQIPFPWRIVAALLFGLALLASGYVWGARAERNAAAAQQLERDRIIAERARQLASLDTDAAVEAERKRSAARMAQIQRRAVLEADIARVGDRSCDLDTESFGVLVDTIRAANSPTAPGGRDGGVPPDTRTR